ncbi:putative lipoprotein aminopeptidase LpqL [Dissostichus eleginoides]|uniref:Lipoprotein aminopeptidase LpqL n=1 Tax=Dissostichus eleginoides TaxID=100907 RepID=A0AAD9C3Q3_DISEL|nr:putative lipoprotein aminopeptidase LpqL [Dissostichus eleginoides]
MLRLQPGEHVWIKDTHEKGTVVSTAGTPRSYIVETPRGPFRRNRYHLSSTPEGPRLSDNTKPVNTTIEAACTPATPEVQHDSSQQSTGCERRFPARVRAPPAHLKDFVRSLPGN